MSTEKLGELSKPVFEIEVSGGHWLNCTSGKLTPDADADFSDWPDGVNRLYSQEYVSALLAELEAKDEALRELAFRVSAGGYNADSVDAEVFKQKIIDGIDSISGVLIKRIDELSRLLAHNIERAEDVEKRLATPIKIVNYDEFFICHVSGASDDYCKGWVDGRNAAARDVGKAGFTVEDK